MTQSKKCKKSQESQSAVTKLFRKLSRNTETDTTSSEKQSLLKRKKKSMKNSSCESRLPQTNDACQQKDAAYSFHCADCDPPDKDDETCSRTSCALMRLINKTDVTKTFFLVGSICAIVLMLICLSRFSSVFSDTAANNNPIDDRTKRQSNDEPLELERNPWDVPKSKPQNGFPDLFGTNSRDAVDENTPDLSTILDPVSVNEAYSSNSLRDFYRKLIKTDVQIKNLRNSLAKFKYHRTNDFMDSNLMRTKRSPKISIELRRIPAGIRSLQKRSFRNPIQYYPRSSTNRRGIDRIKDTKINFNMDDIPDSKILHEYRLNEKKIDSDNKYSHSHVDPNTMKHQQGIKNSNNVHFDSMDDILRRILEKQPAETDRDILHRVIDSKDNKMLKQADLIKSYPIKARPGSLQSEEEIQSKMLIKQNNASLEAMEDKALSPFRETPLYMHKENAKNMRDIDETKVDKESQQTEIESPELNGKDFEYRVTLATTMSVKQKQRKETGEIKTHFPKIRHLLQHEDDEDDDDTDYEYLTKEPWERDKRAVISTELAEDSTKITAPTADVSQLVNSNWKGPMPLYHNELNYMIKAAMNIATNKLPSTEKNYNDNNRKHSYVEYDNVNSNNNYDELVEIAQAYSDYGVLKNKKDTVEDNKTPETFDNLMTAEKAHEIMQKYKNKNPKKSSNKKPAENFIEQDFTKQKELYPYRRRSLKSLETEEHHDDNYTATNKIKRDSNNAKIKDININDFSNELSILDLNSKYLKNKSNIPLAVNNKDKFINVQENVHNLGNVTIDYTKTSVTQELGEVFSNIVNLCMFLFSFGTKEERRDYNYTKDDTVYHKLNSYKKGQLQLINPINDSEMIGHKSRVLLSFEETESNDTSMMEQQKEEIKPNLITNKEQVNTSQLGSEIDNSTNIAEINSFEDAGDKALVKRSIHRNHIFWNDLYDDEYGIKDPLENEMKDKSFVKYNDLLAKSENWIGAKFKQIANNMRMRKYRCRQSTKKKQANRNKTKSITKRSVNKFDDSGKQTFEALTANMKRVIHEAAEAIRETTSREVRSDKEQAATLMQQLVSLMSALVDIQVRQKTCLQLPDDLRNFLVWLTSSNSQGSNDMNMNFNVDSSYDNGLTTKNLLNVDSFDMMPPNARSECLGTIHDVQDLIQQYDEMSERDKSKMSKVREYLEHQLDFLQKQLSNYNEYGFPFTYQENIIRERRQLPKSLIKHNKNKPTTSRKTRMFIKYFVKKRTTVEDSVNERRNKMEHTDDKVEFKINENNKLDRGGSESKIGHENAKRAVKGDVSNKKRGKKNVKGVYYNAQTVGQNNHTDK